MVTGCIEGTAHFDAATLPFYRAVLHGHSSYLTIWQRGNKMQGASLALVPCRRRGNGWPRLLDNARRPPLCYQS